MTFSEIVRPITYKAVPFVLISSSTQRGRRLVEHPIDGAELPIVEDRGALPEVYSIEGVLVGQGDDGDYFPERDRLNEALRDPTGGTLVHPYEGTQVVNVRAWSVTERASRQRVADYRIEFVKSGDSVAPLSRTLAPAAAADAAAAVTTDAADARAADELELDGPDGVIEAAEAKLKELGDIIRKADVFRGAIDDAARLGQRATQLVNDARALASQPATLVTQISASLKSVRTAAGGALSGALAAYESAAAVVADLAFSSQPDGSLINAASTQTSDLIRFHGLAGAVQTAVRMDFRDLESALAVRARLAEKLIDAASSAPGSIALGLTELLGVLSAGIPRADQAIGRVRSVEVRSTSPAYVIAYEELGETFDVEDLADRNGVRNPLFVPGGETVEVLVR